MIDWLVEGAPPTRLPQEVALQLARRLVAQGLPLYRTAVFVRTLHPNVLGRGFIWHENRDEIEVTVATYDFLDSDLFLKSPIRVVFAEHVEVRRRIADPACPMDFPVLEDFRREGVTDFLALPLRFLNGEVHAASFATRRAGGFAEAEIAALRQVSVALSRIAEIYALTRKARHILDA